jgi:hypothetical protein
LTAGCAVDGSSPETLAAPKDFARKSDPPRAGPRSVVIWTAFAEVTDEEGRGLRHYSLVFQNEAGPNGATRARVVVSRAESVLRMDRRHEFGGVFDGNDLPGADGEIPAVVILVGSSRRIMCSEIVVGKSAPPAPSLVDLWGYSTALLDDSSGETGRYLQRRLRLMAEGAWRDWTNDEGAGPPPAATEGLEKTSIRVAPFLAGLVLGFDASPPRALEVPAHRLGRAIAALGLTDELAPWLSSIAEDESVDAFNRLRASMALFGVWSYDPGREAIAGRVATTRTREDVTASLSSLRLSVPARIWLSRR